MSNNSDFKCRQNWSKLCEEKLNIQINLELLASYNYFYLSSFFGRDDIGLKKLVEYFNKASLEEREHSQIMIEYQNKRGGKFVSAIHRILDSCSSAGKNLTAECMNGCVLVLTRE